MTKVYVKVFFPEHKIVFGKIVELPQIPQTLSLLKICSHSFIVSEVEHDIDGYVNKEYENGVFCDTIKAELNREINPLSKEEQQTLQKEFVKNGWIKWEH